MAPEDEPEGCRLRLDKSATGGGGGGDQRVRTDSTLVRKKEKKKVANKFTDARRNPFVVVGVDADRVALEVEGELAELDVLELVLVQVGPPPDACVDDVRETLPSGHLQTAVERALDGDALAGVRPAGRDRGDEAVQFIPLFLDGTQAS